MNYPKYRFWMRRHHYHLKTHKVFIKKERKPWKAKPAVFSTSTWNICYSIKKKKKIPSLTFLNNENIREFNPNNYLMMMRDVHDY